MSQSNAADIEYGEVGGEVGTVDSWSGCLILIQGRMDALGQRTSGKVAG